MAERFAQVSGENKSYSSHLPQNKSVIQSKSFLAPNSPTETTLAATVHVSRDMIPNWFVSLFLTDSGDACIFFPIDAQASGVNCGSMSLSNTFCIGWQGIKIAGLDTFANLTGTPPPHHPPPARSSQLQTHTLQVFLVLWLDVAIKHEDKWK